MKNIIIGLLAALGMFALFYLIGCFIEASFNINSWEGGARIAIGFFGGLTSLILGALTINYLDDQP